MLKGTVKVSVPYIKTDVLLGLVHREAHQCAVNLMMEMLRETPIWSGDLWASLSLAARRLGVYQEAEGYARYIYQDGEGDNEPNLAKAGPMASGVELNNTGITYDEIPRLVDLSVYSRRLFERFNFMFRALPNARHKDQPEYAAFNEYTDTSAKGQRPRPWNIIEPAVLHASRKMIENLKLAFKQFQSKYVGILLVTPDAQNGYKELR